jgi:predicted nucleic acid-binding Zn ribbon protein
MWGMQPNTRNCVICGATLEHKRVDAKTCSEKCKNRFKVYKRRKKGYDSRYSTKDSRVGYLERVHAEAAATRARKRQERENRAQLKHTAVLVRKKAREQEQKQRRLERDAKTIRAAAVGLSLAAYGQLTCRYRKYGLTVEDYVQMKQDQHGICANTPCGTALEGFSGHVDHCHQKGRVRGILCPGCNSALGHVHDSPSRLRGLIEYLGH